MEPTYIGDSVYIREGSFKGQFILYLDNGLGPHTEIYIEREQLLSIIQYVKIAMEDFDEY